MAVLQLYSVKSGKVVDWDAVADPNNGEIIATHGKGDNEETLKFPAGLTKPQLLKLIDEHNKANDGVKERTDAEIEEESRRVQKTEDLLNSL